MHKSVFDAKGDQRKRNETKHRTQSGGNGIGNGKVKLS